MSESSALIRRIALSMLKGMNVGNLRTLSDCVGSPDDFFDLPARELCARIGAEKDFCRHDFRARLLEAAALEAEYVCRKGIRALWAADSDYPRRLLVCDDAPAMIYVFGNANLDSAHVLSVVGTRHATSYGVEITGRIISELASRVEGLLIVSGLAYGIDIAAHKAAMDANVPTAAVVAHGLNTVYPADHRRHAGRMVHQGGALITEYISGAPVHRGNFLRRNRIIAALADVTLVVESDIKGGALTTARLAAHYSREVGAVPGRVGDKYSSGCNELVARGNARMVRCADDLIDILDWPVKPEAGAQATFDFDSPQPTPEQARLIAYIADNPSYTINDMAAALGMDYSTLIAALSELELSDFIVALPGGRYRLKIR